MRYAACVCARAFLLAAEGFQEAYFPASCRTCASTGTTWPRASASTPLDTWKLVMKDTGPRQVAQHAQQVRSCRAEIWLYMY